MHLISKIVDIVKTVRHYSLYYIFTFKQMCFTRDLRSPCKKFGPIESASTKD